MAAPAERVSAYCRTTNVSDRQRCRACERPLLQTDTPTSARPGLACLRCREPLQFMGERGLLDIQLEFHVCAGCGHLELLLPGVGKDLHTWALPIPASSSKTDPAPLPLPHEPRDDG